MATPLVPDLHAPPLAWAQWYAMQGWPVLPMHTPSGQGCSCHEGRACKHPGKHPHTPKGRNDASTNQQTIAAWWTKWPDANIAIRTDGLFVLDIDPRHQGQDHLRGLEKQYGKLPDGPRVISGSGGDHYYFTLPVDGIGVHSSNGLIAPGVDIKSFQENINVPPSLHASGQTYLWDALFSLDAFPLTPPPDWLVDLARQARPTKTQSYHAGVVIPDGQRYHYLISAAGRARYQGFTEDQIVQALQIANQNCDPPEDDAVLQKYAKWAAHQDMADAHALAPASLEVAAPVLHWQPPSASAQWGSAYQLPLTDFADMLERIYPIPQWIVKDLIPEGLTFFVGSPKSSKTYLAYSLALSLVQAMADPEVLWLGQYDLAKRGPVIYVTLEDDEADTFYRIKELAPGLNSLPRDRLLFIHDINMPPLGEGLVEILEEQVFKVYDPALLVLDPISYLYAPQQAKQDQFAQVKKMLLPLRWLGKTYHCGVLGVDHRRKKSSEDVDIFETQYGSNAKVAVNDAQLVIVRDDTDITVHCQVRKARNQTLSLGLTFTPEGFAEWTWKGSADGTIQQGVYGDLRMQVLAALQAGQLPLDIPDILVACSLPDSRPVRQSIDHVLRRAIRAGEVVKGQRRGQYVWAGGN